MFKGQTLFVSLVSGRMDIPDMSIQGAIDRVLKGMICQATGARDRAALAQVAFDGYPFLDQVLYGWDQRDLKIASGLSREQWLKIIG